MPRTLCALLLLAAVAAGQAATQVVLHDGRTLDATGVERRDDVYVFALESGGVLTVPVALVARIRTPPPPAEAPSGTTGGVVHAEPQQLAGVAPSATGGWVWSGPQQLAGEQVFPLDPARALEVLGGPSIFRPGVIDPNWAPRSGFPPGDVLLGSRATFRVGPIDSTWEPRSAFSDEDVLAGSRATFRWSLIDSTWVPEDGFARKKAAWGGAPPSASVAPSDATTTPRDLSHGAAPTREALEWARLMERGGWYRRPLFEPAAGVRFEFDLLADRPSDRSALVRGCAREIFNVTPPQPAPEARKLGDPRYALLPLDVFEAATGGGRAVFTVAGDACHAVGGDLRDPLGVPLSREQAIAAGIDAYNASLGARLTVAPPTDQARIEYVSAVVAVVDPDVSGRSRGSLLLVPDAKALDTIVRREAPACAVEAAARRKAAKLAEQTFEPPRVATVPQGGLVEFFTWSSVGGEIVRHSVALRPDGRVAVARQTIASHVGEHLDRE